jgi:hypothetical protein
LQKRRRRLRAVRIAIEVDDRQNRIRSPGLGRNCRTLQRREILIKAFVRYLPRLLLSRLLQPLRRVLSLTRTKPRGQLILIRVFSTTIANHLIFYDVRENDLADSQFFPVESMSYRK